jgi:hypothetical protein
MATTDRRVPPAVAGAEAVVTNVRAARRMVITIIITTTTIAVISTTIAVIGIAIAIVTEARSARRLCLRQLAREPRTLTCPQR